MSRLPATSFEIFENNQMARGGKRENAGREPGAITKRSREIADKALTSGLTPLDYLAESRHFSKIARRIA